MKATPTLTQTFDPHKSFFGLPIVQKTVYIILSLAIISWFTILTASDLWFRFNWTYTGFNNLIVYFKVPISLLAMLIPIGAVYAANHRSEQTKEQIKIAQNQNLFSNYYKHLEEFDKYLKKQLENNSKLSGITQLETINCRHIHKLLYPNLLTKGELNLDSERLSNIWVNIISSFNRLISIDITSKKILFPK